MRFVDTNVLLYAVSTTPSEAAKTSVARGILEADDLALSVQVLQEFYVQATRPGRSGRLSHEQAALLVGCETLLSEDLAHGRSYDGVRVMDPFRR